MQKRSVFQTICVCAFLLAGASALAEEKKKYYDASGRVGENAKHGSDGVGSGSDGRNAGPASPGEHGGKIDLHLSVPKDAQGKPIPGVIVIKGSVESQARANGKVEDRIEFGKEGYFFLDVSGGKGGAGGKGGDGARGKRGSDGSDATRYSSGSDGGDGGPGGDGGDGSPGARGGKGGKIRVQLDEKDTHLVMLYTHDIEGGSGGAPGAQGQGGEGGPGGSGGSSYSWTEDESYTDSNGERQTRSVRHSNSGGSDGSRGRRGSSGSGDISAGAAGDRGSHQIEVLSDGKVVATYPERYSVFIEDYKLVPRAKNGVLEPGEKVFVSDIRLSNQGKMPTPPDHDIVVLLKNTDWAVSKSVKLKIPKSLAPGESITLKRPLVFDINDTTIATPGQRFRAKDTVTSFPFLRDAERPFNEGVKRQDFEITFPVEIEPVVAWNTLAPGEKTRVEWKITNISGEDIGTLADVKKNLKRDILQKFVPTGQAAAHTVVFDDKGIELGESGTFLKAIEKLKAGESRTIEGAIGFTKNAQPYTKTTLDLTLELGKPQAPMERRPIQKQILDVQVGQGHLKSEGSNVLLITNHKTTAEEVDAWREQLRKFGQNIDTYNLSYEGEIQFQKIFKDYKWGSVILLNNPIEVPNGPTTTPDAFLSKTDFFRTVSENDIQLGILGSGQVNQDSAMKWLMMPATEFAPRENFSNLDKFKTFTRAAVQGPAISQTLAEPLTGPAREITVEKTYYILEADAEKAGRDADRALQKAAEKAQKELVRSKPGERHFIYMEKDVQPIPYDGMTQRWQAGRLIIQRSLDAGSDSAVLLEANSREIHEPKYILSAETERNAALVLEMPDKVRALNRVMDSGDAYWGSQSGEERLRFGRELIAAILFDLAGEQRALLQSRRNFGFNREMLQTLMPHLEQLVTGLRLAGDPNALQMTLVMELAAQVRHMSSAQISGWHYLLPGMRTRHLARATEDRINFLLDQTIGGPKSKPRLQAETHIKALRKEYAVARKDEGGAEIREKWRTERKVLGDTDLARNPAERILRMEERTQVANTDAVRVRNSEALKEKIALEKARYVSSLDGTADPKERAVMEAIAPISAPGEAEGCLASTLTKVGQK